MSGVGLAFCLSFVGMCIFPVSLLKIISFPHYAFFLLLTSEMWVYFCGAIPVQKAHFLTWLFSLRPSSYRKAKQQADLPAMLSATRRQFSQEWIGYPDCPNVSMSVTSEECHTFLVFTLLPHFHLSVILPPVQLLPWAIGASCWWSFSAFDLASAGFENVLGFQYFKMTPPLCI